MQYETIMIIAATKFELTLFCNNILKKNFVKMKIDFLSSDLKRSLYVFINNKILMQIIIIFSGVGKRDLNLKQIFNFLAKNLNPYNDIDNFNIKSVYLVGLSGSCNENNKIGDVLRVGKLRYGNATLSIYEDSDIILYTADRIMNFKDKENVSKYANIVDMETFFWVKEIEQFVNRKNIKIFRSISDGFHFKFPIYLEDIYLSKKIFSIIRGNVGLFFKNKFLSSLLKKTRFNLVRFFIEIKRILSMKRNFFIARKKLTKTLLRDILGK